MLGDDKSVLASSMQANAKLCNRHTILYIHQVIECIASKIFGFSLVSGEYNPTNVFSKHWRFSKVWTKLNTLLFWIGYIFDIND
jgi:hypothetical protein